MRSGQKRGPLRGLAARAVAALAVSTVIGAASVSAQPNCVGDCNDNGAVNIAELIRAVGISLGNINVSECTAADANGNGTVAINELIQAVNNSLFGCNVAPPTPTPLPEVFDSVCTLADTSELNLLLPLPATINLFPLGEIGVSCTDDGTDLSCTCEVQTFDPVNIIGLGDVCIEPFTPCPARVADCDGNDGIDVNVVANRNVGQCTSPANCASVCDAHCDGLGAGYFRQSSTCEDFCLGGSNDGNSCSVDANCPGGSCGGPEGGVDGTICECVCAEPGVGTGTTGGLSCSLGVAITVELDEDGVCGNVPPTITLAPLCGELTSGVSIGRMDNAANMSGLVLGPTTLTGAPSSCEDVRAETVSGAAMVGHLGFFGSSVGDILSEIKFVCE